MDSTRFINESILLVEKYLRKHYNLENSKNLNIFVVWSCKILQNNKALLSTNDIKGLYFEVTFNGNMFEYYIDVYKKTENYVEE